MTIETSYSVLVADDDATCRDSLRALLEREGLRTYLADSGGQALDLVERKLVHLVILDLHMPDITGIETLKRIIEIKRRMPSIIMSGDFTTDTKVEAMSAGAFSIISKPIQSAILRHAVHQVIDRYYSRGPEEGDRRR